MKQSEGTFKSPNGTTIFHQSWLPEGEPEALILLVHGLAEHSSRYMNVVNHLVPQGFVVCALDHPGHGKSEGRRKYINTFDEYTDTLEAFSAKVRAEYPRLPVFLVGHSLGGLIAVRYLLEYQHEFRGAVISAPAIQVFGLSPALVWVGKLMSAILPKLGLIPMKPEGVSRDPAVVKAYLDDPLVFKGKTTARLAAQILKNMHYVLEHAHKITLPLLIVQGDADVIINPVGAGLLCDAVSSQDVKLNVYNGLYHEVFNEPEHRGVLADVSEWLHAKRV